MASNAPVPPRSTGSRTARFGAIAGSHSLRSGESIRPSGSRRLRNPKKALWQPATPSACAAIAFQLLGERSCGCTGSHGHACGASLIPASEPARAHRGPHRRRPGRPCEAIGSARGSARADQGSTEPRRARASGGTACPAPKQLRAASRSMSPFQRPRKSPGTFSPSAVSNPPEGSHKRIMGS